MTDFEVIQKKLLKFREDRNWRQFHNPKDLAISLCLEAAEVLEHFQWKNPEEIKQHLKRHKSDVAEELADVLNWIILIAHDLEIDLAKASLDKIEKNAKKYPTEKTKGRHTKYTDLD